MFLAQLQLPGEVRLDHTYYGVPADVVDFTEDVLRGLCREPESLLAVLRLGGLDTLPEQAPHPLAFPVQPIQGLVEGRRPEEELGVTDLDQ